MTGIFFFLRTGNIIIRFECILLKFHWGMKALIEAHFQHEAIPLRSTLSYPNETLKECIQFLSNQNISVKWRVSYKRQQLLALREHLASPPVLVGSVLLISLVSCVVFFPLFVLVLCLVYPMLPVSLDCPFLIAHSGFSNVNISVRYI